MKRQEFVQIDRPSQLIRVAVEDARKLDRGTYHPHAHLFHSPSFERAFDKKSTFVECNVCLAGAVIAKTLRTRRWTNKGPSAYSWEIYDRLKAIDDLRTGDLYSACCRLWNNNFDMDKAMRLHEEIERPVHCDFLGWKQMDAHLESLERYADKLESEGY